jgi:crotonobetainyl-CoA:carnitine CoA-transferase CaiB-like acyl-CoA transferase
LRCGVSVESLNNAILQWKADELENAAAEAGLIFAKVRTFEEFRKEVQYTDVLSRMPLITVETIGESQPIPFKKDAKNALDGIRAFGMGHVIAGAATGRDLACYGADVLNIWRPDDTEIDGFVWDVQLGMRSTMLDRSKEDRAKFDELLKDADIFFANRRPGYLERDGLDAETLSAKKPGLIHTQVLLHGNKGPWKNRPGFDEIGAAVTGLFAIEGTITHPKSPPIIPIVDNVVGWLGTVGILAALRRRAVEGGSYRVTISLTRTVLWLLSLGIFDKDYAKATAGSSDEHANIAPDLFTVETPLGSVQSRIRFYCPVASGSRACAGTAAHRRDHHFNAAVRTGWSQSVVVSVSSRLTVSEHPAMSSDVTKLPTSERAMRKPRFSSMRRAALYMR